MFYERSFTPFPVEETETLLDNVSSHQKGVAESRARVIPWFAALDVWLVGDALAVLVASNLVAMVLGTAGPTTLLSMLWAGCFAAMARSRHSHVASTGLTSLIRWRVLDWCKAALLIVAICYATNITSTDAVRWAAWTFGIGTAALMLVGMLAKTIIFFKTEAGSLGTRVAVYGCGEGTDELLDYISSDRGPSAHVVSLYDSRTRDGVMSIGGHIIGRDMDDLVRSARLGHIDSVMLNLPASAIQRINDLVHRLEEVNVDILMAPSPVQMATRSRAVGYIGSIPTVSIYHRPIRGLEALGKVVFDRLLAGVALLTLAPFILAACILIKLESPGSPFFIQKRRGLNNQPFEMFKLRSMYTDPLGHKGSSLVTRHDARVTRVGAVLRRTSFDEIPQLLNVMKGEMSLVGPRPHLWEAKAADRRYEELVRRYPARHRVLPGITGLAQVRGYRGNGNDEAEIINRVNSDLEYIDRWSMPLDMAILTRTICTVLFHKAY